MLVDYEAQTVYSNILKNGCLETVIVDLKIEDYALEARTFIEQMSETNQKVIEKTTFLAELRDENYQCYKKQYLKAAKYARDLKSHHGDFVKTILSPFWDTQKKAYLITRYTCFRY